MNGMDVSPGPPTALNPHSVGNTLHPQSHHNNPNIQASVSPPGTANPATAGASANGNFFPFMLPYPYAAGYGLPTAEQQAGLAELLLQQQRLNAAAAQLIGMPQLQQQQQQSPAAAPNGATQFNGLAPGAIPPYSLLFPGLLGGFQSGTQQQLYQNYQQQYGQFAAAAAAQQLPGHQHAMQSGAPQQQSNKATGGIYPDLDDLMKNENMPPNQRQQYPVSNGYTSGSNRTNGSSSYNTHHSRSDSSNGASPVSSHHYHSVSPQPPAYIPSRHHPDYNQHHHQQQQQQYAYGNGTNNNSASHLFQKNHSAGHNHHSHGNTVLGKGKRGFESEADTLLNDLKKKRYDGTNGSACKSASLFSGGQMKA